MILVYVAGALMGRRKADVLRERAAAVRPLRRAGFDVYDPFDGESWMHGKTITSGPITPDIMHRFINKDMRQVRKADVMLVLTGDTPTDGTWDEKVTAWNQGSLVILVAPERATGKRLGFSTIRAHHISSTIKDAVAWIKDFVSEDQNGTLWYRGTLWPR